MRMLYVVVLTIAILHKVKATWGIVRNTNILTNDMLDNMRHILYAVEAYGYAL